MADKADKADRTLQLALSVSDVNLLLEALGGLPYIKVYALIQRLQEQARAQLTEQERA